VTQGVDVSHILGDGGCESHAAAMDRLLRVTEASQSGLFFDHAVVVEEALQRRAKQVAWRPG
jgi:predicted amidohydrolase YtcJ